MAKILGHLQEASLSTYEAYGVTYGEEMDFVRVCMNIITIGMLKSLKSFYGQVSTDTYRLTTGIPSEKCVVWRFPRANVIECTYTNLDSIAYYLPTLYGIAYYS